MSFRFVRWSLAMGAGVALLHAQTVGPQARPGSASVRSNNGLIDYNIQAAPVDSILDTLEELTGRTVIRPQALSPATYTINLVQKTKAEIILALETELEINQVAVIPLGDKFLEVMPLPLARSSSPEFITGSTLDMPASGQIASKLFQLEFLRAAEFFSPQLQTSLYSPNTGGSVIVMEKSNSALVTDTIANLQRTERLIAAVDKPTMIGLTPKFYKLNNATASVLVTKLRAVLTGPISGQIGTTTTFNADDRTQQIVLLADPRQWPLFDELIAKLDVETDPNTHNDVIFLKHADAQTLVQVLGSLVQGQVANSQKAASASQSAVRTGEGGYQQSALPQTGGMSVSPIGSPVIPQGPGAGAAPPAALTGAANAALNAATAGGSSEFSTLVTVVADERSNSIIVSGTASDVSLMHEVVEKLDAAVPEVRIEVIIAEVTLDDTTNSGLAALGLTIGTDNVRGTHVTNFTGSIPGWDVSSGVVNPLAFAAALNTSSAGQKSLVKIVQADVIMASHAKLSEIIVGEQDPIINGSSATPTGTTTTGASALTTTESISYESIGLDLKVTPLIGDNGDVQLNIDQLVNDISGTTLINGNPQPIIANREAKSYCTVKDGEMLVLGGLQLSQKSSNQGKIGLLYEIPILSQLLGAHTDELKRTELLLFVRPHIVQPATSTAETMKDIKAMSNKDDVIRYLGNPADKDNNSKVQDFLNRFKDDD
jgi:general secretion pathway protein D